MSLLKKIFCVAFFPTMTYLFLITVSLGNKNVFCSFLWIAFFFFFLRIIAPKIKDFLLFIQVYMVLSDKCRMKGKSSLTTTLLNNLDLWIPAPLRADLTQEPRNLGLVLRQGGCWTSSVSGGSQAFQAAFLLFFLMLRKYFLNITSKMDSMLSPGH